MIPLPRVCVALDQGGHATRASAYDLQGRLVASSSVAVKTRHGAGGQVEHDGEELVAGLRVALYELDRQVPAGRWLAAGLAVQRSSIACWHRDTGELLGPVISWQDRRQAGWLQRLGPQAGRIHLLTGLPLSPHYGACKLRWCLDHLPAVRAAADAGRLAAGPLASLLLARLLEARPFLCDEANASRTQLWSPRERRWSPELLDLFGLSDGILPELSSTRAGFGSLRVGEARVPLVVCTGDQAAVPFASGPLDPDSVYANLGTGAFALRPVSGALVAPPLLTSVLDSDADGVDYVLEGTVNGAGSALEWYEREEGLPSDRMLSSLEGLPPPSAGDAFFLNGVAGLGSPFWVPDFVSRYVGAAEPAERFGAVVESIAFLLQANLDEMSRHAGRPARIVASGGLARSGFLLGILAAVAALPVQRLDDPEATARGLAFLAAGMPRDWQPAPLAAVTATAVADPQARYLKWRALLDEALAGRLSRGSARP